MHPGAFTRLGILLLALGLFGCGKPSNTGSSDGSVKTIGVTFETLQTEGWVISWETIKEECRKRGIEMIQGVADGDANKQFELVRGFLNRRVDGVIIAPKDAKTVIPMIKACNAANVPCVLFNRPADPTDAKYVSIAPDNVSITKGTVEYLIEQAKKTAPKTKAMVLVGDLGDINAIGRRDGFDAAVKAHMDSVEVVARVATEWNQEKALAGVASALQGHPDIGLIFSSSDFLFPSIKSVLSGQGRWKKVGEPGHVVLGGFDGDQTAYQWMVEGYVDATGVQDLIWEAQEAVKAIVDMKAGKTPPARIEDKGFVFHQGNMKDLESRMWGAVVAKRGK